jgi:hypothetical protein
MTMTLPSTCTTPVSRRLIRHLVTTVAVVALAGGASLALANAATAATPSTPPSPSLQWGHPTKLGAGQPHSAPDRAEPGLVPHVAGTTNTTVQSANWSGYAESGPQFTGASAEWVVPTVQPSQTSLFSASWVGVDGFGNSSLIQTGTAQQTSNGSTSYFAWYEILPANAITIGGVSPGDLIRASVAQAFPGTWTIALTDLTSNQAASFSVPYSGPEASAEFIEEAPTVSGQQSALANFGTATFTNISSTNSNPSAVQTTGIDMIDGGGHVIATPGAISNNSFTVTDDSPSAPVAATTTQASVNPASATSGTTVTYSASVTAAGGTPTGHVTFATGSTTLCTTGSLVNGSGSCTATSAPVGADTITASYSGATGFATSSGTASLTVSAPATPTSPTTPTTPTSSHGYWLVGSDGGIFTFGSAQFHGSTGSLALQRPVVGITPTADRAGYWLVASDGGVFTFGDAGFFGSIPGLGIAPAGSGGAGKELNAPVVGMVPSADGRGYFMVAADGGVFAFGDATFEGSCPGIGGCAGAGVTVMPDASGNGYWLVTATGHVYTFGDAPALGAPGPQSTPVTSAVRTPDGQGYWILFADGTVDAFGDAAGHGDPVGQVGGLDPATAIFATADGQGYWVTSATGAIYGYGDAPNLGGTAGTRLNGSIIAGTGF